MHNSSFSALKLLHLYKTSLCAVHIIVTKRCYTRCSSTPPTGESLPRSPAPHHSSSVSSSASSFSSSSTPPPPRRPSRAPPPPPHPPHPPHPPPPPPPLDFSFSSSRRPRLHARTPAAGSHIHSLYSSTWSPLSGFRRIPAEDELGMGRLPLSAQLLQTSTELVRLSGLSGLSGEV